MTTFTIPLPPTANHIWKSSGKRRFLSSEYRAFKGMVALIVKRERVPRFGGKRMAVAVELCFPNRRRCDISNRVKALEDALTEAGVWDDDSQVDQLHVRRGEIVKGGCAVVTLEAI